MKEEWRTVVHNGIVYEKYEVSNMGNVRNSKHQILKPAKRKNGYLQVLLYKNGKRNMFLVHRLVAFAFIPNDNPQEKTDINHIDENKSNNMVDNLEWCSKQYNIDYSQGFKVLCVETGIVYNSTKKAARETGLQQDGIWKCCVGKRNTCGGYHWKYVD